MIKVQQPKTEQGISKKETNHLTLSNGIGNNFLMCQYNKLSKFATPTDLKPNQQPLHDQTIDCSFKTHLYHSWCLDANADPSYRLEWPRPQWKHHSKIRDGSYYIGRKLR